MITNSLVLLFLHYSALKLMCVCVYSSGGLHKARVDLLCDVDALSVGQPPIDGRPRGRRQGRVEGIDVEAQVERPLGPKESQVKVCFIAT